MTQSHSPPIVLLVVGAHEIARQGLCLLLERAPDLKVAGEADSVASALAEAKRRKPDVVLLEVRLGAESGIDACRQILATVPQTRILFLASDDGDEPMLAAVRAGAHGYLFNGIRTEALLQAIRDVAGGGSVLDPAATRVLLERTRGTAVDGPTLTSRERRVLALVAQGRTNKEIASALGVSTKTIKNDLSGIFQKLRVTRRSEAAAIYSRRSSDSQSA